jgi:hypothetical protein
MRVVSCIALISASGGVRTPPPTPLRSPRLIDRFADDHHEDSSQ